jgi:protein associated with RNAse G/E
MKLTVDYVDYDLDISVEYDSWREEELQYRVIATNVLHKNRRDVMCGPTLDRTIGKLVAHIMAMKDIEE